MDVFYSGNDIEALNPLLAPDLKFEGPFYTFNSSEEYLNSLRRDPPGNMSYQIIKSFERDSSLCLIYKFSKPGISTLMAQLFEIENEKIAKILLIFDTSAFSKKIVK
jgi:hypothetical protein